MKKLAFSWIIPLLVAIILVVAAKVLMFSTYEIKNDSMSPNLCKGDIALCIKKKPKNRNKIVLYSLNSNDSLFLKRQIAIAGDTIAIKHGAIIVNGRKVADYEGVISNYVFCSDSIAAVSRFLNSNELKADFRRAHLGIFDCDISAKSVEVIKSDFPISFIKKKSIEPNVRLLNCSFGRDLYWNYDNLGSLIVPQKGMRIKLGKKSFILYKNIIEDESGDELKMVGNNVFLGGKKADIYTFEHNYVFLVNDNRSDLNDSRSFGLIARDKLIGTFLFKLPW